jgi:hypothetical protein
MCGIRVLQNCGFESRPSCGVHIEGTPLCQQAATEFDVVALLHRPKAHQLLFNLRSAERRPVSG